MTSMKSAARGGMVLVGSAALCVSMTACGGKSHHASSAKAAASSSHMKHHKKKSGSSKSSCSTAKIGGVNKCIQAGQMCSHKHASDYKSYGFVCSKKNNRYVLHKK